MQLRWGILGSGKICNDFSIGLSTLPIEEHKIVGVGARNLSSAEEFAKSFNIPKSYGSYEGLLSDPEIDIIYIGTINCTHLKLCKLALDFGKHVLCEKPICVNVKETEEVVEYAKKKKLFLMEGMWTRFFPVQAKLLELLKEGTIGEVMQIFGSFGFIMDEVKEKHLYEKETCGGSTFSLGYYCVQLAYMVFNKDLPDKIITGGHLSSGGVDQSGSSTFLYSKGRTATFVSHYKVQMPNECFIVGTKGTIKIESPFWCPTKLTYPNGQFECELPKCDKTPNFVNPTGFSYECSHVRNCISEGLLQSPLMTHEDSLNISKMVEAVRKQIGVIYPQDL